MIVDERLCKELTIIDSGINTLNVKLRPSGHGYVRSFAITINPTSNCQLASANNIGSILNDLNIYHLRDLFIKIRQSMTKRILLLDLNSQHINVILKSLPKGAILINTPYISTNGSSMNIILIKLASIRQLQLPK